MAGQTPGSGSPAGSGSSGQKQASEQATISSRARENARYVASKASEAGHDVARHYVQQPAGDLVSLLRDYAKEKPDVAALWCFAFGIIVGWKIKP
ncbi:hypothetical protein SH139x_005262 [Planctomycetaceae bacterium SH139]